MNPTPNTLRPHSGAGLPPRYERLKEEHEVAMLGASQGSAPAMTTVISVPSETSVPDHVVWSLFNALFLNFCCLGFAAYAYSVKSRDRKMVGDVSGARAFASTAQCLNICALVFSILSFITVVIVLVTTLSHRFT